MHEGEGEPERHADPDPHQPATGARIGPPLEVVTFLGDRASSFDRCRGETRPANRLDECVGLQPAASHVGGRVGEAHRSGLDTRHAGERALDVTDA